PRYWLARGLKSTPLSSMFQGIARVISYSFYRSHLKTCGLALHASACIFSRLILVIASPVIVVGFE
ncbi:MAG: hypothetical protein ABI977_03210, partial [Acidobacteriota bacterium]